MLIPLATYRIQFVPTFGFKHAQTVLCYLSDLGISHLYASPIFKAKKGSQHGYDVVDPNSLNPELGSTQDFENLISDLKKRSMFWLQDIVPNHMAFDMQNSMLMDILENAEYSPYYQFFDIDWNHPYENIRARLVAPFLGKFYAEALESGEIQLRLDEQGFSINYYNLRFPLRLKTYLDILDGMDQNSLKAIMEEIKVLKDKAVVNDRPNALKIIKQHIWTLYQQEPSVRQFLDAKIQLINGEKDKSDSFQKMEELLSQQLFRLTFWKYATEELNYRRFFTVNDLISVRIENPEVREKTHALILEMVNAGKFNGLRVDHVDGLYDPTGYLKNLSKESSGVYTVVEKILQSSEHLPEYWKAQGTTGYDYIYHINSLFCHRESARKMSAIYMRFTEIYDSFEKLSIDKKRGILGRHMVGDIDNLAQLLKKISGRFRYSTDITIYGLKRALVELMAVFSVYRTYIDYEHFSETDKAIIKQAAQKARASAPGYVYEFNFIEHFLLLDYPDYLSSEEKAQWLHFVMRFQQFTGPLMAKGFEDTVLYVYNRLISLNEVGGNPGHFGITIDQLHTFHLERFEKWPGSLNATSTHDTKRSEDVRCRINVLSEIPREWEKHLHRWGIFNRKYKKNINHLSVPSYNDEYFLYQTLLGAFPFDERENNSEFLERIKKYMVKSIREAKVHTAWLKPDLDYENGFMSFIEEILRPGDANRFLKDFIPFQKEIAHYGIYNSLSTMLVKLTAPGVPDFYQGCELWDFSLVDPDNRREVDFQKREKYLNEIKAMTKEGYPRLIDQLFKSIEDGRLKLFLIWRLLQARTKHAHIFQKGNYQPLSVEGRFKNNLFGFIRQSGNETIISLSSRFLTDIVQGSALPVGDLWGDTTINFPPGLQTWSNAITDESYSLEGKVFVKDIFKHFPGAVLIHAK